MNLPVKQIRVGRRFRKDLGDVQSLADSMDQIGLLHPVVVTPQDQLVAGRRRLEAARFLGWRTIPVHVVDLENIVEGELAENVHRKDFLPSELWAIAKKVKEIVRTPVGRPSSKKPENYRHFRGDTRDKTAACFGISGRHLDKIGAICESEFPDLLRVLKPGGFMALFQGGRYMRYFWEWFGDQDFIVYAACREPLSAFKGGQPINCCWTPVVMFYKGRPKYRSAEFTRARNWFVTNSQFDTLARVHPCPEPMDQCEELIRSFTCKGALVLDCFSGVGSIPIAAARHDRRYLGIEIESKYVQIARRRMRLLT